MSPEEDRKQRIKFLFRQEERKKRLPEMLEKLMQIIKETFTENDVLTLEQIDEYQRNVNSTDFEFNYLNLSFPKNQPEELEKILLQLKPELSKINYFRFSKFSDIAVLNVNTNFIIENFEEIVALDGNTFSICDKNFKNGLWIDMYTEYWYEMSKSGRIPIYEIRIFGKEWIKQVLPIL